MASDWIKMRTDLYRDPKVCVMADLLMQSEGDLGRHVNQNKQRDMCVTRNVMRNATVGALLSVWGVMRMRGKSERSDLVCRGVTMSVIDDIADMPGFGEAMESVGWAVYTGDGVSFPRFFEDHNVDPEASAKSKSAERQQRFRDRQKENSDANSDVTRNVTRDVTVTHREEKSREEKKESKTLWAAPDWVPTEAWKDFEQMRVKRKKPLTDRARDLAISKLNELRAAGNDPAQVIEQTILHAWDTFYPIKRDGGNGGVNGTDARYVN